MSSTTLTGSEPASGTTPKAGAVDMKFEIVVIPVSDVDRAKRFYGGLGWRPDADFAAGDDWRVIQFTPPGSSCSVIFGRNVTAAAPGSARGLYLIVSDIEAARNELLGRGVEISEVFHDAGDAYAGTDEPYLFGRSESAAWIPSIVATAHTPRSVTRTATAGCSRKSPRDCLGRVSTDVTTFTSPTDLESALRRAAAAHGKRNGGQRDENWPNWYAEYIVAEYAGKPLPR